MNRNIKKILTASLLGIMMTAMAAPVMAWSGYDSGWGWHHHHYHHYYRHYDNGGDNLAAGLLVGGAIGLMAGAAMQSNQDQYYRPAPRVCRQEVVSRTYFSRHGERFVRKKWAEVCN